MVSPKLLTLVLCAAFASAAEPSSSYASGTPAPSAPSGQSFTSTARGIDTDTKITSATPSTTVSTTTTGGAVATTHSMGATNLTANSTSNDAAPTNGKSHHVSCFYLLLTGWISGAVWRYCWRGSSGGVGRALSISTLFGGLADVRGRAREGRCCSWCARSLSVDTQNHMSTCKVPFLSLPCKRLVTGTFSVDV
jgi:hypothetical protein